MDCFIITESWFKKELSDNQYYIGGCDLLRLDREFTAPGAKTGGGGLVIYTATDVNVTHYEEANINNKDLELLYIQIKKGNYKTLNIISLYRPPDGNVDTFTKAITKLTMYICKKTGHRDFRDRRL